MNVSLADALAKIFDAGCMMRSAYMGTKIFVCNRDGQMIATVNIHALKYVMEADLDAAIAETVADQRRLDEARRGTKA